MSRHLEPPADWLTIRPGYVGMFCRSSVPGAFPSGARIVKAKSEEGDAHDVGSLGTVLGSISHPDVADGAIMYFVEWDDAPQVAVAIVNWKVRRREAV